MRVHFGRKLAQMANVVLNFPSTSPAEGKPPGNSPVLVQLKLAREFVIAIDTWRKSRSVSLPRTQAIVELSKLGLAGEALDRSKTSRRRRR
jgi:hypothetical protein